MLCRRILAVVSVLFLTIGTAWADPAPERPAVEWLMWDTPPYHIPDGFETRGVLDGLVDWLAERLPEYDHLREFVAIASRTEILKTRDLVCVVGYYKTQAREAYTEYTRVPPFIAAPLRLFVEAGNAARFAPYLDKSGTIDLAALIADGRLAGGREEGRSYTPPIDGLLDRASAKGGFLAWPRTESGFGMLAAARLDWLIDYPEAALLGLAATPATFRYRMFPIAGADTPRGSYVGCSKKPGGIALIGKIDRLLATAGPHPAWQVDYESWLDPARQTELRRFFAQKPVSELQPR